MNWPTAPLWKVAPAKTASIRFSPTDHVWHLTLDQIESNTSHIINKRVALASEAGTSSYVFDDRNVLYSKLRPYLNKVVCPSEPGIATTELIPLRPRPDLLDRRFLAYYLRSRHFLSFANIAVAGVKMPRVIMPKFWDHQIALPPLSEQQRIVEILDQADTLRKKRAGTDAKAARILPILFYKMFGDPAANPKGWRMGCLGDVSVDMRYGTSVRCEAEPVGLPVLRIPNIIGGRVDLTDLKHATLPEGEMQKLLLDEGDLLFVRTNGNRDYVGRCAIFEEEGDFLFASYLIRGRLDKSKVDPKFIAATLGTPLGRQAMSPFIRTTAGQSNINLGGLRQVPLILPPLDVQMRFRRQIDALENAEVQRRLSSKNIETLFQSLLHRAFTGDLTSKWCEAHMKELMAEMETQAKALGSPFVKSDPLQIKFKIHAGHGIFEKSALIGNDLKNFRPAYLKIQEDMKHLSHVLNPSYLNVYEQMERALEPIRRQHLEMTHAIELSGLASSPLAQIARANQRFQEMVDQATASGRVLEDIRLAHQTWLDKIKPMQDSIAQLEAVARISLSDVAYRMTITERLFAGIDFEAMRRAIALPESAFLKLENVIGDITLTYERLASSVGTLPNLTHLPAFSLSGATREVFLTGYALDAISIPDQPHSEKDVSEVQLIAEVEQETSGCVGLLQAVDPGLARPYMGAHDAVRGRSADRTRHVLSSLRELWNHLLHRLAPDEHVLSWASRDDKELFNEGRPTRKARVLYICRDLNHEPLTDFVVHDTRALVKLVEFFNRVHELEPKLTDEQLRALLLRTDSWLTYILQIWEGTR